MNSEQILYPAIPSIETNTINIKQLSDARVNEMMNKKKELEKELKRYAKIRKRWGRADVGIKITGIVLASTGAVAGILTGVIAGPLLIPIFVPSLPIIVGVLTASETILTGGLVIGLTSKKKAFYRDKCNLIQSYIDKMYLYIEKARNDNIITIEELDGFRKLMDEYNVAVRGIKVDKFDFDKLHKDIKKELQKELVEEMKEKEKQQYRSQLGAAYGTLTRA